MSEYRFSKNKKIKNVHSYSRKQMSGLIASTEAYPKTRKVILGVI